MLSSIARRRVATASAAVSYTGTRRSKSLLLLAKQQRTLTKRSVALSTTTTSLTNNNVRKSRSNNDTPNFFSFPSPWRTRTFSSLEGVSGTDGTDESEPATTTSTTTTDDSLSSSAPTTTDNNNNNKKNLSYADVERADQMQEFGHPYILHPSSEYGIPSVISEKQLHGMLKERWKRKIHGGMIHRIIMNRIYVQLWEAGIHVHDEDFSYQIVDVDSSQQSPPFLPLYQLSPRSDPIYDHNELQDIHQTLQHRYHVRGRQHNYQMANEMRDYLLGKYNIWIHDERYEFSKNNSSFPKAFTPLKPKYKIQSSTSFSSRRLTKEEMFSIQNLVDERQLYLQVEHNQDRIKEVNQVLWNMHGVTVNDYEKTWKIDPSAAAQASGSADTAADMNNTFICPYQRSSTDFATLTPEEIHEIETLIMDRHVARKQNQDYESADEIQQKLLDSKYHVTIKDHNMTWYTATSPVKPDDDGANDKDAPPVYKQVETTTSSSETRDDFVLGMNDEYLPSLNDTQMKQINEWIHERSVVRFVKNYKKSDELKQNLYIHYGIELDDYNFLWKRTIQTKLQHIDSLVKQRRQAQQDKKYDIADFIQSFLQKEYGVDIGRRGMTTRDGASNNNMMLPPPYTKSMYCKTIINDPNHLEHIHKMTQDRIVAKYIQKNYKLADEIQNDLFHKYHVTIDDETQLWSIKGAPMLLPYKLSPISQEKPTSKEQQDEIETLLDKRNLLKYYEDEYEKAQEVTEQLKKEYNVYIQDGTREWCIVPPSSDGQQDSHGNFTPISPRYQPYALLTPSASISFPKDDVYFKEKVQEVNERRLHAMWKGDFRAQSTLGSILRKKYHVKVDDETCELIYQGIQRRRRRQEETDGRGENNEQKEALTHEEEEGVTDDDDDTTVQQDGTRTTTTTATTMSYTPSPYSKHYDTSEQDDIKEIERLVQLQSEAIHDGAVQFAKTLQDELKETHNVELNQDLHQWSMGGKFYEEDEEEEKPDDGEGEEPK